MAASRLSDAQRDEIVAAYRQGASASALAAAFGCSPNTVSRVVKTALSPEELAALKLQRGKGEPPAALAAAASQDGPEPQPLRHPEPERQAGSEPELAGLEPDIGPFELAAAADGDAPSLEASLADGDGAEPDGGDGPGVLAIDDADDFAADDGEEDGDELEPFEGDEAPVLAAPAQAPVECRCLSEAQLPPTAYLLVDKTVELQPVPLSACPDLGPLPEDEAVRQALQVYVNPRNAKRQCGRSQRVIPLPDLSLLQRTAPYLLAQGISRVVIEGSVYSLPGS